MHLLRRTPPWTPKPLHRTYQWDCNPAAPATPDVLKCLGTVISLLVPPPCAYLQTSLLSCRRWLKPVMLVNWVTWTVMRCQWNSMAVAAARPNSELLQCSFMQYLCPLTLSFVQCVLHTYRASWLATMHAGLLHSSRSPGHLWTQPVLPLLLRI